MQIQEIQKAIETVKSIRDALEARATITCADKVAICITSDKIPDMDNAITALQNQLRDEELRQQGRRRYQNRR